MKPRSHRKRQKGKDKRAKKPVTAADFLKGPKKWTLLEWR